MKKTPVLSRREFIRTASMAAAGGSLLGGIPVQIPVTQKTRVVLIRDREVLDDTGNPRQEVVQKMLDGAIMALVGEDDPVACWKTFISRNDLVGIKSNVWQYLPTPPQVEEAIKKRVMDAGVPGNRIGIRDRGLLRDPIFLNATALINVRPMRSHHWSGVGSLIKNYITFVNRPADYHGDSCADLASIWKLPLVKGKTRLNILVMLTPQFHGVGPHSFNPAYVWKYHGIMVGFDPVAVDSTGVRIIQSKRKAFFREDRPLNPPPRHIFLADTRHGLGTSDPDRIHLIRRGYNRDILI